MEHIERDDQEGGQEEPGALGPGARGERGRRSALSDVGHCGAEAGTDGLSVMEVDDESAVDVSVGGALGSGGGRTGGVSDDRATAASEAIAELSELLPVFRLLAARSLISSENSAALEALVFPVALSRRR